jgi:transcriptional regulator with GAF, ATPase, and Fis domain
MRLRGTITAVLYLDHRFDSEVFTTRDIPIVEAFADQAALAVETAQLLAERATGAERLGAAREELETLKAEQDGSQGAAVPTADLVVLSGGGERFGSLIGGSAVMRELYDRIERAARATAPVLITGESGTGKELVAKEIHARGTNAAQPFLCENCAAIADALLESELFGHRRGSFTGATADHQGLFVRAGDGSLFLDEVGDMSSVMQSKLLRVLQEGRVRPVGSEQSVGVSCRVVAATHRDLRGLVRNGDFREDLFYRLDVLRINVPPLRKRPEDIPVLLAHFLVRENKGLPLELTPKALELLVGYSWPGNVRELENEARRLSTLGLQRVTARQLSDEVRQGRGLARAGGHYSGKTLKEVEREMVMAALRETGGNKARAARQLGIPKTSLYHLLERFELR